MRICIKGRNLCIYLSGMQKIFSFKSSLTIPIENIVEVSDTKPRVKFGEIKWPGTAVPGIFRAGTYYTSRGKEFWYVTTTKKYLVLKLRNEDYNAIVLSCEDNEKWIEKISKLIKKDNKKNNKKDET